MPSDASLNATRPFQSSPHSRPFERPEHLQRLAQAARGAIESGIKAGVADYDRSVALRRFHRLSPQTLASESPQAAREVIRELERALRGERARRGHWTYDLNRHIALLTAHRAETERLRGLSGKTG
jgi:hypothetical protein